MNWHKVVHSSYLRIQFTLVRISIHLSKKIILQNMYSSKILTVHEVSSLAKVLKRFEN
jgi:hypothetical protein